MITNGPNGGQNNTLFLNNASGGFNALTGDSIVLDNKPSDGATWADTDNDGDEDCFVVNWYGANNLFYTNNGSGGFVKINSELWSRMEASRKPLHGETTTTTVWWIFM